LVNRDCSRNGCPEKFDGFLQQNFYVQRFLLIAVLPAESQDLFDQILCSFGTLQNILQILFLVFFLIFIPGQFCIADNDRQDVVEVVSNASGQCANGLHFLRLEELGFHVLSFFLCLLAGGDVANYTNQTTTIQSC